jgi:hypothetical protein
MMMFNGEMIRAATSAGPRSLLDQLVAEPSMSAEEKVDYLFMAGLARRASRDERTMAMQLYQLRNGNARQAMEDLWWVILNSNEFIFNH